MGYVKEKYTKTYFTGHHPDGTLAHYGLLGNYNGIETQLRDFDVHILDKINFQNTHVLEIGFGRGESIAYVMDHGAASYIGVDFAAPAFEMASEYLTKKALNTPKIYCDDALDFLRDRSDQITHPLDVVLMLDVVEHIPRHELSLVLIFLKKYLSEKAVIVINTPVYQFDNDVISDGIDERNFTNAIDQADFIEETKGMHCNKYSLISLQEFMRKYGYFAATEGHVFIHDENNHVGCVAKLTLPYAKIWAKCFALGYPLKQIYLPDEFEYAYQRKEEVTFITCKQSYLEGMHLYAQPSVIDSFQDDTALAYLEKYVKPGQVIFDVGSYIGLSALFFAKLMKGKGRVICFEPNKYNLLRSKINFSANFKYIDCIDLYPFGLAESAGEVAMLLNDNIELGYASTSQLLNGGKTAIPHAELESMGFFKETVTVKTLDNFVKETGVVPHLIKVDIEGAEVPFLKGSFNTLTKYHPDLFIELHNTFAACSVMQILKQLNYEFHILSEERGDRVQGIAVHNSSLPIGLSNKVVVDTLFQSYCSYKAKLYQENLENYSKQQRALSQAMNAELHASQLEREEYRKKTNEQLQDLQLKVEQSQAMNTELHASQLEREEYRKKTNEQLQGLQLKVEQYKKRLQVLQAFCKKLFILRKIRKLLHIRKFAMMRYFR